MRRIAFAVDRFTLAQPFVIARGSRREAVVITATIDDGNARGRGECVPYARYGESVESVLAQMESVRPPLEGGLERDALGAALPAGAARNAIDCALWDF